MASRPGRLHRSAASPRPPRLVLMIASLAASTVTVTRFDTPSYLSHGYHPAGLPRHGVSVQLAMDITVVTWEIGDGGKMASNQKVTARRSRSKSPPGSLCNYPVPTPPDMLPSSLGDYEAVCGGTTIREFPQRACSCTARCFQTASTQAMALFQSHAEMLRPMARTTSRYINNRPSSSPLH